MQQKTCYLHRQKFVINCSKMNLKRRNIMKDFKLPMDFVDNYILKAKPEYVMVYLYAYRHKAENKCLNETELSSALGLSEKRVKEAIEYWTNLGFDIFTVKKFPPKCEKSRYSAGEIAKFTNKDKELAVLYEETEKIMNKPLSTNDQQTLFWIYNDLGMSTSMIILMLNYAKSKDKCKIRYIEKIAFEWSEKGISTFEDAEKYLSDIERAGTYESRIKKLFGLERNFISTEKSVIAEWCNELKPTKEELIRAYEICIERTGKFSAKYINAILINWRDEKKSKPKTNGNIPTPKATKFNNFESRSNIDYKKLEMDALKKKISKIKAGENND